MAGMQAAEAFDFSLFEPKRTTQAVLAEEAYAQPAPKKEKSKPNLKVVPNRTRRQEKQLARVNIRRALLATLVLGLLFGVISLQITSNVRSDTLEREIENMNANIRIANSENVRLASAIDGMFSISNVEEYATGVLGMSKLEDYQIEYVDLSAEDKVLYSGAQKSDEPGLLNTIQAYITELFA